MLVLPLLITDLRSCSCWFVAQMHIYLQVKTAQDIIIKIDSIYNMVVIDGLDSHILQVLKIAQIERRMTLIFQAIEQLTDDLNGIFLYSKPFNSQVLNSTFFFFILKTGLTD